MKKEVHTIFRTTYILGIISLMLMLHTSSAISADVFTITTQAIPDEGGSIIIQGAVTVPSGGTKLCSIIANDGYYIQKISTNTGSREPEGVLAQDAYVFTNVTSNCWINVTFGRSYTITTSPTEGGTITPAGPERAPEGEDRVYAIAPLDNSYILSDVMVDGWSQGAQTEISLNNIMSDHTVSALFVKKTYTITAMAGPGGSITPSGTMTVEYDGTQEFRIRPAPLYAISAIILNGETRGYEYPMDVTELGYRLTNIRVDSTVEIQFMQLHFGVVATANQGGVIQPSGVMVVESGEDQEFVVQSAPGYHIERVEVNGVAQPGVGPGVTYYSYKFENIASGDNSIEATFASDFLTITPEVEGDGSISPAAVSVLARGSSQEFTMVPNDCQRLADVLVDGQSVMDSPPLLDTLTIDPITGSAIYTFNNALDDHSITAVFGEIGPFIIAVTSGDGAIIRPGGELDVRCGDRNEFTITTAQDHANTLLYAEMNLNVDASLLWNVPKLELSAILPLEDSFIVELAPVDDLSGISLFPMKFRIKPDQHWALDAIVLDDQQILNGALQVPDFDPDMEITITENETIILNPWIRYGMQLYFTPRLRNVTSHVNPGDDGLVHGGISPEGISVVRDGEDMTFTIEAYHCSQISNVKVTRGFGSQASVMNQLAMIPGTGAYTYTLSAIQSDCEVEAIFDKTYFTATASVVSADSDDDTDYSLYEISPTRTTVECGDDLILQIQESSFGAHCYDFELTITSEGGGSMVLQKDDLVPTRQYNTSDDTYIYTYQFSNVQSNPTAELIYTRVNATVTTSVSPYDGGTIQPGGAASVLCGSHQTFQITPGENHRIKDVLVDGGSIIQDYDDWNAHTYTGLEYTLENVTGDHTIESVFQRYYTIYVTAEDGGNITSTTYETDAAGNVRVDAGVTAQLHINTDSGYHLGILTVDDLPVSDLGAFLTEYAYTFEEVSRDHTMVANFGEHYTITATVNGDGAGGAVAPIGASMMLEGENQTYTFTPDDCYEVSGAVIDGLYHGSLSGYTFENISRNHTVDVTFAKPNFTVVTRSDRNGKIKPSGKTTVGCGDELTFTITPESHYQIDDVTLSQGDGDPVSVIDAVNIDTETGVGTYNLTDITNQCQIYVSFKKVAAYTVTASVTSDFYGRSRGQISPEGTMPVELEKEIVFTLTPDPCSWIGNVEVVRGLEEPQSVVEDVDIDPMTGIGTYRLSDVQDNIVIEATFREIQPNISVKHGGHEDIYISDWISYSEPSDWPFPLDSTDADSPVKVSSSAWLECGADRMIWIVPDECYSVGEVKVAQWFSEPVSVMDDVIIDPESGIGLYSLRNIQSSYAMEITMVKNIALNGDVNGDCAVNSTDAMLALRIVVGQIIPTAEQKEAADMNEDGEVAANDVLAILYEAAKPAAPRVYTAGSSDRQTNITLADARGVAGESVIVPVQVDDIGLVAGGDISIAYDSSVLQAVDVSSDVGALLAANVAEPGMVRIAFADTNSLNGKILANIRFHILADHVSELTFQKAKLYRPDALPLDAKGINSRFESWGIPPEHSALLQNFPNPSNPETWIPYQLKEDGQVAIQIFSVQGELVRDLNLGYRSAGSYINQDRAAHWDGRNESGEEVASGTYFYSLRSSHFFIVRKLIILR